MKVNGKSIVLCQTQSLYDFLIEQKLNIDIIAVECNGEIVCKSEYKNKMLTDEDTLVIVQFIGGG